MDIFEIYAEIPKRLYGRVEDDDKFFNLPSEVTMSRKRGSRCCHFVCEGKEAKEDLTEFLDNNGISWQVT